MATSPRQPPKKRRWPLYFGGGVLAVAVLVLIILFFTQGYPALVRLENPPTPTVAPTPVATFPSAHPACLNGVRVPALLAPGPRGYGVGVQVPLPAGCRFIDLKFPGYPNNVSFGGFRGKIGNQSPNTDTAFFTVGVSVKGVPENQLQYTTLKLLFPMHPEDVSVQASDTIEITLKDPLASSVNITLIYD